MIKAESSLSLLVALLLFSLIYLGWSSWQSMQNMQSQQIFQKQQALQIAENQIARRLANVACQSSIEQNSIRFEISRCSDSEIEVRFPAGKILINSKL